MRSRWAHRRAAVSATRRFGASCSTRVRCSYVQVASAVDVETEELLKLTALLPPVVRCSLEAHPSLPNLVEVVMDLGRPSMARFPTGDVILSQDEITEHDLEHATQQVGEFDGDNRAGIDATLHRVSCIRNRQGRVVGLTCRVGRAIPGTADLVEDLARAGRSILLLGPPGVGKTTAIRDLARLLSEDCQRRVVVVDTSNEIGGDGDVPHPAIGGARRMQVAHPLEQHRVMIEAVENHMPEAIIIDEISTEAECLACRTIAQRGVQLIATAHGAILENVMKNPALSELVGGIQSVTLGDDSAKKRGTQKSILERREPPCFDVAVEILQRSSWKVHLDVATAVDSVLAGMEARGQLRERDELGRVLAVQYAERTYVNTEPGDMFGVGTWASPGSGSGASWGLTKGGATSVTTLHRLGSTVIREAPISPPPPPPTPSPAPAPPSSPPATAPTSPSPTASTASAAPTTPSRPSAPKAAPPSTSSAQATPSSAPATSTTPATSSNPYNGSSGSSSSSSSSSGGGEVYTARNATTGSDASSSYSGYSGYGSSSGMGATEAQELQQAPSSTTTTTAPTVRVHLLMDRSKEERVWAYLQAADTQGVLKKAEELDGADVLVASLPSLRANSKVRNTAKKLRLPTISLKATSASYLARRLAPSLGLDPLAVPAGFSSGSSLDEEDADSEEEAEENLDEGQASSIIGSDLPGDEWASLMTAAVGESRGAAINREYAAELLGRFVEELPHCSAGALVVMASGLGRAKGRKRLVAACRGQLEALAAECGQRLAELEGAQVASIAEGFAALGYCPEGEWLQLVEARVQQLGQPGEASALKLHLQQLADLHSAQASEAT